jgi:hypothetical protein
MPNERTTDRTLLFALQNETQDKIISTEAGDLQGFAGPDVERVGERSGGGKGRAAEEWYAEAHTVQLRIQREMSGEQRILIEFEMSLFARELAREGIHRDHPEWSETQVARELIRLAFPAQSTARSG